MRFLSSVFLFLPVAGLQAAFVIQIDVDGADDGVLTLSPNFSYGGDTSLASQSSNAGTIGTADGDSIFGGNGINSPDTYLYTYLPGVDGDNTVIPAGTPLTDEGVPATGLAAGNSGLYKVWATWPRTNNVSGGDVTFILSDGITELFNVNISQITENPADPLNSGAAAEWVFLGQANLDATTSYTLSQIAGANTFVSMRATAVMFEAVPEPSTGLLALLGTIALFRRRR